jgi:hypothetical protein
MNKRQSLKQNRVGVDLKEMLQKIKFIGIEVEICQIDYAVSTHRDRNTLSKHNEQNKGTNCLAKKSNPEIKSSTTLKLQRV